ncbi:NAD(P)H-binding protein [Saccharibacter sp. 17.LH.SD]|uniref:SDR family oxidoreductase n=1 Tax=Saccharibacter sp. 17.LH.SD TaxID=2689393 RepID=UPI001367AA50|nr:SDR family oxidoreductase [Saccharibacter sp. 17.LH.SD]MXV43940.1 NAD(P)H-binding protein [Saccharibacter sp. 17.LH.SD]
MSQKILVIGAAGKVGKRLVPLLVKAGHQPFAMHRRPEQSKALENAGAVPVLANLAELSVEGLAALMEGMDAVVFSAGAGGASIELINAIDGEGLKRSVDAAHKAGVGRFLHVSAYPKSWREEPYSKVFEHYFYVKKQTDIYVTESELDWVILRPSTLSDEPGKGRIKAGLAVPYGIICRDDVAATLVVLTNMPKISRRIIEMTDGDDVISESLQQFMNK